MHIVVLSDIILKTGILSNEKGEGRIHCHTKACIYAITNVLKCIFKNN